MYVESIRYHLLRAPTRAHAAHCDNPILFCGHPLHVGNQFSAKALQLLCSQGMLQKVPNLKANLVSITRPKRLTNQLNIGPEKNHNLKGSKFVQIPLGKEHHTLDP